MGAASSLGFVHPLLDLGGKDQTSQSGGRSPGRAGVPQTGTPEPASGEWASWEGALNLWLSYSPALDAHMFCPVFTFKQSLSMSFLVRIKRGIPQGKLVVQARPTAFMVSRPSWECIPAQEIGAQAPGTLGSCGSAVPSSCSEQLCHRWLLRESPGGHSHFFLPGPSVP